MAKQFNLVHVSLNNDKLEHDLIFQRRVAIFLHSRSYHGFNQPYSFYQRKMIRILARERERERPGIKGGDERVRVFGLEGREEGPHVPYEGPTQITWRKRVLLFSQLGFVQPPICILHNPSQDHQNSKYAQQDVADRTQLH